MQRILLISGLIPVCTAAFGDQATLSQQLLDSYFKTAGVCTTSQVEHIHDTGGLVTIEISIEAQTRNGLQSMTGQDRDNWFSLHCPPEIHGVWHQKNPPLDIQVAGQIGPDERYTLSCAEFQQNQWTQRESSLQEKVRQWLEKRLE